VIQQDSGVLFENSIVCLVVFVCCFWFTSFSRLGVGCFLMPVFGVLFDDRISLIVNSALPLGEGFLFGEFDSGSGRTLAACLTHASRTERPFGVLEWRTGE
jgi:hypothetical protein